MAEHREIYLLSHVVILSEVFISFTVYITQFENILNAFSINLHL